MSERLFRGSEVLHEMRMKIIAKPAREQTFSFFRYGAIHMLGYLLVSLHGYAIRMAVGIVNARTNEHGVGIDEEKRFGVQPGACSVVGSSHYVGRQILAKVAIDVVPALCFGIARNQI